MLLKAEKLNRILTEIKKGISKGNQEMADKDDHYTTLLNVKKVSKKVSLFNKSIQPSQSDSRFWHLLHLTKLFNLSEPHLIRKIQVNN